MCQLSIEHQMVRSFISYCYAFIYQSLIFFVVVVHDVNLSLAAEVTCISVSPGFWMAYPMILVQGLPLTLTAAYINSQSM